LIDYVRGIANFNERHEIAILPHEWMRHRHVTTDCPATRGFEAFPFAISNARVSRSFYLH